MYKYRVKDVSLKHAKNLYFNVLMFNVEFWKERRAPVFFFILHEYHFIVVGNISLCDRCNNEWIIRAAVWFQKCMNLFHSREYHSTLPHLFFLEKHPHPQSGFKKSKPFWQVPNISDVIHNRRWWGTKLIRTINMLITASRFIHASVSNFASL